MASTGDRSGSPFVVIVVALAGLLSTLGAAGLSGYWTNASVQRQFQSQRNAEIQDQRRQVYVDYIGATAAMCAAEQTHSQDQLNNKAEALSRAYSRAQLIATPDVRKPLDKLTEAIGKVGCSDKADPFLNAFLDAAKRELDEAG